MNSALSLIVILIFWMQGFGQDNLTAEFAIVSDKDGYLNVRSGPGTNTKIIDTLHNGHIIFYAETDGNWTSIFYKKINGEEVNGFVYKDRYKKITDFQEISMSAASASSSIVLLKRDSIQITVSKQPFEKSKHTFQYYKDMPSVIEKIDHKQYWGTDGGIPRFEMKAVEIRIGNSNYTLPATALEGLYEPNIDYTAAHFDKSTNTIYIQSLNSDGAGAYYVIWKVENGVYKERLVVYGL